VRLQPVVALNALDLEGRDHDVALAAVLEVEERIRDRDGHLMAHLRGAQGVGPDQDIGHLRAKSYGFFAGAGFRRSLGSEPTRA